VLQRAGKALPRPLYIYTSTKRETTFEEYELLGYNAVQSLKVKATTAK
jgi:hypothetical protein